MSSKIMAAIHAVKAEIEKLETEIEGDVQASHVQDKLADVNGGSGLNVAEGVVAHAFKAFGHLFVVGAAKVAEGRENGGDVVQAQAGAIPLDQLDAGKVADLKAAGVTMMDGSALTPTSGPASAAAPASSPSSDSADGSSDGVRIRVLVALSDGTSISAWLVAETGSLSADEIEELTGETLYQSKPDASASMSTAPAAGAAPAGPKAEDQVAAAALAAQGTSADAAPKADADALSEAVPGLDVSGDAPDAEHATDQAGIAAANGTDGAADPSLASGDATVIEDAGAPSSPAIAGTAHAGVDGVADDASADAPAPAAAPGTDATLDLTKDQADAASASDTSKAS